MLSRYLLLALGTTITLSVATAADWPEWRGVDRLGKSQDTGLLAKLPAQGPKLLWSINTVEGIGTGHGTPAVIGEIVYILGGDGKEGQKAEGKESLTCLNSKDGSILWKSSLDTASGSFQLQKWGRGTRSTPTIVEGKVFVLGVMGDLCCFTADEGKLVWKKNLVKDFGGRIPQWGYSESPLVDGNLVVTLAGAGGGIVAVDKTTGNKVWQCNEITDQAGYSSFVVATIGDVRQYITQTMNRGLGVRASDGKLLWKSSNMQRSVAVIPTPIVHEDHVFFTNGYGNGCEMLKITKSGDDFTAQLVYSSKDLMANHHGQVILHEGHVYGHTEHNASGISDRRKGTWVCFPFKKDAEPEVSWRSDQLEKGSITYADGHFYCYGEDKGTLVRIKATPDGWLENGRFAIPKLSSNRKGTDAKVWAIPVIAHGKLYLRDYELLFCYDLKGQTN